MGSQQWLYVIQLAPTDIFEASVQLEEIGQYCLWDLVRQKYGFDIERLGKERVATRS